MKTAAFLIVSALILSPSLALAHHGHNHRGQGHSHDGTPGGTRPAFTAGHCKHHPHGCGGGATISAAEPELGTLEVAVAALALLGGTVVVARRARRAV